MIEIDEYYFIYVLINGEKETRVIKILQYDSNNIPYGVYSYSNYMLDYYDVQGTQVFINDVIRLATEDERLAWNKWAELMR